MKSASLIAPAIVILVLGWVAFGYRPSEPPIPPPDSIPVAAGNTSATPVAVAVDSARLLTTLSVLAHDSMEGRAPGTEGSRRARDFIVRALSEAGAEPFDDTFEVPFRWGEAGAGVNVVARIGVDVTEQVIVLTAHYDHLGIRDGTIFNGTDDNASGTAALIEIARNVAADPLENTLVLAVLDAEEVGLQGARAFAQTPPVPISRIGLNVNMDMVSRSSGLLWASGAHHTPALRTPLEVVAARAPVTLRLRDDWTSASDHEAFHSAGIPFVYFGVEDHPDYHQATDDFEKVIPGDYVNAVRTILDALRELDRAMPFPPSPSSE